MVSLVLKRSTLALSIDNFIAPTISIVSEIHCHVSNAILNAEMTVITWIEQQFLNGKVIACFFFRYTANLAKIDCLSAWE